jgi:hypothetical protein
MAVEEFCANHDIEISYINSLQKYGMIEITTIEKINYLNAEQLQQMDRYIRLYYKLKIRPQSMNSIVHLLLHIRKNYRLCDHLKYMS